jgi:uncharacterized protein (TIGR02391 family)
MALETQLDPRLWNAVRASYEARNYSAAILDAIHLLSDVIRERAGVEGDGVALVGSAFGGATPRLKVNALRTESERNVQRGVESLLRGIYQSIRNPRSHGNHAHPENDSNSIILFVDYLIRVIGRSKSPFSLDAFVKRILDADFVPSQHYAALLVGRIPRNKLLATCLEVFGLRQDTDMKKVRFFYEAVISAMSDDERGEFLSVVSEVMASTEEEQEIIFVLEILPGALWVNIDEIARIRIENKLIDSVRSGAWSDDRDRCLAGGLGTWIGRILSHLTLKDELWRTIASKLRSDVEEERAYAFRFFADRAPDSFASPPLYWKHAILDGLQGADARFQRVVEGWQYDGESFDPLPADHPWVQPFLSASANVEKGAPAPEQDDADDDIPF